MTISYGAAGTVAVGSTSVAVALPSGVTAGELLAVRVSTKPGATAEIVTPTGWGGGWARSGESVGTNGTNGADTGPTRVAVFVKVADGTESGTLTVSITSGNASTGQAMRFTTTGVFSVEGFEGQDTSSGTGYSAACTAYAGAVIPGDMLVAFSASPSDTVTWASQAFAATGLTIGSATEIGEAVTSTGNDIGGASWYATVSSGTMSGSTVTASATLSSGTNAYGPVVVLRIRDALPAEPRVTAIASGSRDGNGAISVTAPGGEHWVAIVVNNATSPTVTPATNFTLIETINPITFKYECTGSPGSSWTLGGTGDTGGIVYVAGFDREVSVGATTITTSGTSLVAPDITAGDDNLVWRGVVGARDTDVALGFPTAAPIARRYDNQSLTAGYVLLSAIAFSVQDAGATGTATFTNPSGTVYGSDAYTFVVSGVVQPPTGVSATGADHSLDIDFDAVSGADSYVVEWRRTDLTPPSATTQTSAPGAVGRMDDATPGADTTYVYTWDGENVNGYVVDTGVRGTHTEFTGRIEAGYSVDATPPWTDTADHGTAVASAMAGTTYGVAKGATIVPINVSEDLLTEGDAISVANLTDVVDWILAHQTSTGLPGVANFSIGFLGMQEGGSNSTDTQTQIVRLLDAGIPVIVASGNSNIDVAANVAEDDDRVIWAGSSTMSDGKDTNSNYGPPNLIFAPSSGMTAAANGSDSATQTFGYTSGATPLVAGVAIKIKQGNPELSPARIQEVLFSQARKDLITSVPTGPNDLINSDANTDQWSRHPTASTTLTLDGLDAAAAYEIRVYTVDGGVESLASSTDSATTSSGTVTGVITADTPTLTVAVLTSSWSGTVTVPVYAGALTAVSPTVTVDVPSSAWSGTVTVPVFTGPIAADTPSVTVAVPTVSWAGTVTGPTYTGSISADTPPVTVAVPAVSWAGTVTVPSFTGNLTADAPAVAVEVPTVAWTGTVSEPGAITGTIVADTPQVTVATPTAVWAGTYLAPVTGSADATTPTVTIGPPTSVWVGTVTVPTFSGSINATAPTVTVSTPETEWAGVSTPPIYTATLNAVLPLISILVPLMEWAGGDPSNDRDITVTGMIDPRRWGATITARSKTGTISPRRWEGHT